MAVSNRSLTGRGSVTNRRHPCAPIRCDPSNASDRCRSGIASPRAIVVTRAIVIRRPANSGARRPPAWGREPSTADCARHGARGGDGTPRGRAAASRSSRGLRGRASRSEGRRKMDGRSARCGRIRRLESSLDGGTVGRSTNEPRCDRCDHAGRRAPSPRSRCAPGSRTPNERGDFGTWGAMHDRSPDASGSRGGPHTPGSRTRTRPGGDLRIVRPTCPGARPTAAYDATRRRDVA
jgi:hypothetical protein